MAEQQSWKEWARDAVDALIGNRLFKSRMTRLAARSDYYTFDSSVDPHEASIRPHGGRTLKVTGRNVVITTVEGSAAFGTPREGDRVVWPLERGGRGLFMLFNIHSYTPYDEVDVPSYFSAEAVQLERNYTSKNRSQSKRAVSPAPQAKSFK